MLDLFFRKLTYHPLILCELCPALVFILPVLSCSRLPLIAVYISEERSQANNPERNGPIYQAGWCQQWLFYSNARRRIQNLHSPWTMSSIYKILSTPGRSAQFLALACCVSLLSGKNITTLFYFLLTVSISLFVIGGQGAKIFGRKSSVFLSPEVRGEGWDVKTESFSCGLKNNAQPKSWELCFIQWPCWRL